MFNLFKNKSTNPAALWTYSVPYSDHFRGYKRIKLATYNDPVAQAGLKKISKMSSINEIRFEGIPDNGINVYVDGFRAGTIWKHSWEDYFKVIKSAKVEKAHINVDDEACLYIKF